MTKMVFSPVWFPRREVEMPAPGGSIRIPVENRYAFTDLAALRFRWQIGDRSSTARPRGAAGRHGDARDSRGAAGCAGTPVEIRVVDGVRRTGDRGRDPGRPAPERTLAQPGVGAAQGRARRPRAVLTGDGFSLVLDTTRGDFVAGDRRHTLPLRHFPVPHLTRYDFGDLAGPAAKPYAVLPDEKTRRVDGVEINPQAVATEIVVHDRYDVLDGRTALTLDRSGRGLIRYDYVYRGDEVEPARRACA